MCARHISWGVIAAFVTSHARRKLGVARKCFHQSWRADCGIGIEKLGMALRYSAPARDSMSESALRCGEELLLVNVRSIQLPGHSMTSRQHV